MAFESQFGEPEVEVRFEPTYDEYVELLEVYLERLAEADALFAEVFQPPEDNMGMHPEAIARAAHRAAVQNVIDAIKRYLFHIAPDRFTQEYGVCNDMH